jgi:hypothetical protein
MRDTYSDGLQSEERHGAVHGTLTNEDRAWGPRNPRTEADLVSFARLLVEIAEGPEGRPGEATFGTSTTDTGDLR